MVAVHFGWNGVVGRGVMNMGLYLMKWLVPTLCLVSITQPAVSQRSINENQPAQSDQQSKPQDQPGDASQSQPSANSQNGSQSEVPNAPKEPPADDQGSKAAQPAAKSVPTVKPSRTQTYGLTNSYSVELAPEWRSAGSNEIPPPAILSPYAPPFHLSGNLAFSDGARGAILQFATSNNPFIGHDAYWLDTQIHSPSGSGMSLFDFFFYYFFPPSDACIHEVLTTYANASRVPPTSDSPSYMQVYYTCPTSDTLSGYYAAQVSSGITFQLTNDGTRVLAPVGDFYLGPMEQVDSGTITFFIFEAQGTDAVSSEAAERFHLPPNAQGGQPDFFWAIGATSPFPFVADSGRKDTVLLHVAYARIGAGTDAKAEFLEILHNIRAR